MYSHNQSDHLGFLKASTPLAVAVKSGADAILLNSDTLVFPGVFREMARGLSDSDRLSSAPNNATICTFPHQYELGPTTRPVNEVFQSICSYLPAFHYVPTCRLRLFIKHLS